MALNRMNFVAKIEDEYRKGMPDGLTEEFLKNIPVLFDRIKELEHALTPFATTAARERQFGGDLVTVHLADCELAFDMVAREKAKPLPQGEFYYPAE